MKSLLMTLTKLLNVFLDTTPRQWLIFWAEAFQIDWKNPGAQAKNFVLSFRGVKGHAFGISIILHAMVLVCAILPQGQIAELFRTTAEQEIKLQDKTDPSQISSEDFIEISGVYYLNGTEKKRPLQSSLSKLSGLLKQLKGPSAAWATAGAKESTTKTPAIQKLLVPSKSPQWQDIARPQEIEKTDSRSLEEDLSRRITQQDGQFQNCYEGALLKDPSMNGRIEFLVKIGSSQRVDGVDVDFAGVGLPESRRHLQTCLQNVAAKIRFDDLVGQKIAGKKLKFYVVLKSR